MSNKTEAQNKYDGTGRESTDEYVSKVFCFDKYEIVVKLTTDGRFVGIDEVRVNKNFMSNKQTSSEIFTRVDELPPE